MRTRAVAGLLLLATVAVGCGGDDPPSGDGAPGVAWASGDRVRLASGAERVLDSEVTWFAETVEGVAYLPVTEPSSTEDGNPLGSPLLLDDGSGEPVELAGDASGPVASPDGRWLAWNELDTAERQVRLGLVLYDVTTGERTSPFPPDTGLVADRLTDVTLHVTTFRGPRVLDLATGRSRPARAVDRVAADPRLSSPDGRRLTADLDLPGDVRVVRWVDDETVAGVVPDGDLVACDVPAADCTVVPDVPAPPTEVLLAGSAEPLVRD
ncbi:hypothetical protein [uncultured Nocardioides sp.]|uniref:hypothetical protein n=1 Tax=uncultured Nocardioides sp. TaxID=198441 RepID=UPI0026088FD1|nr:hypothetical protein [uncultured Nocardioides sp.]